MVCTRRSLELAGACSILWLQMDLQASQLWFPGQGNAPYKLPPFKGLEALRHTRTCLAHQQPQPGCTSSSRPSSLLSLGRSLLN
jgi:hypothetical protein